MAMDMDVKKDKEAAEVSIAFFKNEAEKVAEFEKMYLDIKDARLTFERQWLLNVAFYFGKHYVTWVSTQNTQKLVETKAPSHRVRMTINKCKVVVRTEMSKLLKERTRGYVLPNTSDDADKAAARQASKLYETLEKPAALGIQAKMREAVFWMSVTGNGFIKVYYDKSSKDFTGTPGAITVESRAPYNIFVPDLLELDIERQPYIIDVMTKPVQWVKDTYGIETTPDASAVLSTINSRMLSSMGLTGDKSTDGKVTVKEIWIKPCAKYPKGAKAMWVHNKIIDFKEGWPYKHEQYPFIKLDHIPSGGFYTQSTLNDFIPLQKEYNRSISQIIESRNLMSKPQWVVQKGSVDVNKMNSQPGLIIEYLVGTQPPRTEAPPPIPGYLADLINRVQSDMNDVSSQHEISKGSTPPGVTAATAISYLQEEDDSKLSLTITSIEEAVEKIASQVLSLVAQFWTVERQITVTGESSSYEVKAFSAAAIRGNTDYRVEHGSAAPRSRAGKQAFLLELTDRKLISPEQALKYMDMHETSAFYEDTQRDGRQAEKENLMLAAGDTALTIHTWDEDIPHIVSHENFMKTEQFDLLKPEIQELFVKHVKAHKTHIAGMYGRTDLLPTTLVDPATGQPILDDMGKPKMSPDNPMLEGLIETIKLQGPPPMPPPPPPPGTELAQPELTPPEISNAQQ
jgi:hypothetical protein